ncbi:HNH endonuclease signature motif containing protein [Nocardia alni]|uniref:HNH endonuclease signature motif containing protein n=1 Tax=Nocardia alni TaxID=2815723 RepID=UPI001C218C2D|nr:HNH endonuclease signature motif containing protein [Nocardia alni]
MFETMPTIDAHPDPRDPRAADSCLADLDYARMVENIACHRKILAAMELWERRMITAAEAGVDAILAGNDTFSEIAARLRCSHTTACGYVEVASLLLRMPILGDTVARGEVDYANLRMIGAVFADDAGLGTLAQLDESIARAAAEFTPSALRTQAWKLWLSAAPDEAAEARRRRATADRRAYVRRGGHGLSWLTACLTDVEGTEADALLTEITATVCAGDPRSKAGLRADGLMALLHGEAALVCGCGQPDCPRSARTAPPRRKPLVQLLVDAETLLGLADHPATLPDGTPVDPELARTLAQDATWQAIITDTRQSAETRTIGFSNENADSATVRDKGFAVVPSIADEGAARLKTALARSNAVDLDDAATDTSADIPSCDAELAAALADIEACFSTADLSMPKPPPGPVERHFLARSRAHRPGSVLGCKRHRHSDSHRQFTGAADLIEAWDDALARNPGLARSDPDGHGGLKDPPPGALAYRPGADVAALVRAQHPTCAFPGCTVASRRCELDHVTAFDHADPRRGGWTIPANLQPLCKRHHDVKSHRYWNCTALPGGARHWRHRSGLERITVPCSGFAIASSVLPETPTAPIHSYSDALTPEESLDLLYTETWWERHMRPTDHPGNDPDLIAHYREHQAILTRRAELQPAPF